MIKKNDEFVIDITDISKEGSGIGHFNGIAVFVLGALAGDKVLCHVILVKKNYCVAKIVEIIEPSPDRIESDCHVSRSCGGCAFREIGYQKELEIKAQTVAQTLKRIGKINCEVKPVMPFDRCDYRNKASFKIDRDFNLGFYAQNTHRIVKVKKCKVIPEIFWEIAEIFETWGKTNKLSVYDEKANSGLVRGLMLRQGKATGEILVTVIINGKALPYCDGLINNLQNLLGDKLAGVVLNINTQNTNVILGDREKVIYGKDYITDILCGKKFNISSRSFYQVNPTCAESLYNQVAKYGDVQGKTVLDLYCGTGTIGLSLSDKAQKIIGVEIVPQAIENAKQNAKLNGVNNAEFYCDDAKNFNKFLDIKPDIVIIDPPRKGVDAATLKTVATEIMPERIVYVSCDVATLARDINILSDYGYKYVDHQPLDMFPGTLHVETVALISRADR